MGINDLLNQVTLINKKYDDIAFITGERFNIFQILGLSTSEVRLHSAFIAELLNPKGTHGLGDVFLRLFIELLSVENKKENISYINLEKSKVFVEKWIGKKDEKKSE